MKIKNTERLEREKRRRKWKREGEEMGNESGVEEGKLGEKQNVIEDKVRCIIMHIYERAREQSSEVT